MFIVFVVGVYKVQTKCFCEGQFVLMEYQHVYINLSVYNEIEMYSAIRVKLQLQTIFFISFCRCLLYSIVCKGLNTCLGRSITLCGVIFIVEIFIVAKVFGFSRHEFDWLYLFVLVEGMIWCLIIYLNGPNHTINQFN